MNRKASTALCIASIVSSFLWIPIDILVIFITNINGLAARNQTGQYVFGDFLLLSLFFVAIAFSPICALVFAIIAKFQDKKYLFPTILIIAYAVFTLVTVGFVAVVVLVVMSAIAGGQMIYQDIFSHL